MTTPNETSTQRAQSMRSGATYFKTVVSSGYAQVNGLRRNGAVTAIASTQARHRGGIWMTPLVAMLLTVLVVSAEGTAARAVRVEATVKAPVAKA